MVHMSDLENEHISAAEVESAALNETALHALQCERCARLIIHYAQTRENTPLEQYPTAE